MEKQTKSKKYSTNTKTTKLKEPFVEYGLKRLPVLTADFPYKKFEKIAGRVPFTLHDWSNILHLSERTIQRYAQAGKGFEGIYVDRILQIERLIENGLEAFRDADAFYRWLKRDKNVLGQKLNFESLYSSQGIQDISDEIGRIQHGVYI